MPGSPELPPESLRLRALGHPTRIALLQHLASMGPQTATACSQFVGASPSACSWHLRALAKAGWVQALPGEHGRERPWQYIGAWDNSLPADPPDPVSEAVESALFGQRRAVEDWYRANRHRLPPSLGAMGEFIDAILWLTPGEVKLLRDGIRQLLKPYRREDPRSRPDHAVRVVSSWGAVPWVAIPESSDE